VLLHAGEGQCGFVSGLESVIGIGQKSPVSGAAFPVVSVSIYRVDEGLAS